ncbi:MAG: DUF2188 domain-containing protein [Veillonellaceae bacterium]|uniref:DUF2188 domain-containing protein n=1 Tax=Gracilinema caldarium TaxID=215591 RepID=UPI0018489EAE|nr:DUF2188 domain-containing protein [Gracilinema caldarium]NMC35246.1 DUF2188 domain-containing protein [Veillonellaceae bacterium]
MPKKERIHITQRPDGQWQGKREGAERASIVSSTQREANQRAIEIAKNSGKAQVIIHGTDGKIREEHTYGSDPYPPKG